MHPSGTDRSKTIPTPSPWRIERTEVPGGDLFEMELRIRYRVVSTVTGQVAFSFRGLEEASMGTSGRWEDSSASGVVSVTLSDDGDAVIVTLADGRTERHTLPR